MRNSFFFGILLYLLLIHVALADYSITSPIFFENAKINLTPTQNLSVCDICIVTTNSSNIPQNSVSFYTNGSYINFTSTANKTISNIAYDNVSDKWTWKSNGTDGILITVVKVLEVEKNYALKVDNSVIEEQRSTSNNILNYSYTVWDSNSHNFEIARYTPSLVSTITGGITGSLVSWYSSLKNEIPSVPTPEPILTQSSENHEEFIPSISPYIVKNPLDIGVHSIEFTSTCSYPIFLNRTNNNIFILSQCSFNSIYVNFLVLPELEVSQLIGGEWIKPEQHIIAKTQDNKYNIVQVRPKSLGVFTFTVKSILTKIKEDTLKEILIEIDNIIYEKIINIIKNIIPKIKGTAI